MKTNFLNAMNEKEIKILNEVHPDLAKSYYDLEKHLKEINSPIRFIIYCGYRNPEDQFKDFRIGRTKERDRWIITGKVKTYCDGYSIKSRHNKYPSHAVDIIATYNNKPVWDIKYYYYLSGKLELLNPKIKCGIHFIKNGKSFEDGGHSEL